MAGWKCTCGNPKMAYNCECWVCAQAERTVPNDYPARSGFFFPKWRLHWSFWTRPRVAWVETRGCMAEMRRFKMLGRAVGIVKDCQCFRTEYWVKVLLDDGTEERVPLRYFEAYRDGMKPVIEYSWS